jgi:hypothetical protein
MFQLFRLKSNGLKLRKLRPNGIGLRMIGAFFNQFGKPPRAFFQIGFVFGHARRALLDGFCGFGHARKSRIGRGQVNG